MNILKIAPLSAMAYAKTFFFKKKRDIDSSIEDAADWLLHAQSINGDGGVAHSFHFFYGWERSYPETTGYIVPTLHRCYLKTKNKKYLTATEEALKYLVAISNSDGSYTDLNGAPQVFDSGQILLGLNYAVENKLPYVTEKIVAKTCHWLMSQQNAEGAFVRNTYNNLPHTYYSRVGAALLKSGAMLHREDFFRSGWENILWTISQQLDSGFFRFSSFQGGEKPALSHTMIYVLEGLLDAYHIKPDVELYACIDKGVSALMKVTIRDGGLLRAVYNKELKCVDESICMTGLCQWSGVISRWARINPSFDDESVALKLIEFAKVKQLSGGIDVNGGLPGSFPHSADYMKFSIPNWGVKFYLDSVFELQRP